MKKSSKRISNSILEDIRRNVPYGTPAMTDEEIDKKTNYELFDHYLNWNGIIGYSKTLIGVIEEIYGVKLEK